MSQEAIESRRRLARDQPTIATHECRDRHGEAPGATYEMDLADAAWRSLQMDDRMHTCSDEGVYGISREAGHEAQRFETSRDIRGRVRMDRPATTLMTGIHRRKQVDDFRSSDLTDHDTVGAHAQGLAHQIAQGDLTGAFEVGWTGLETDDMGMAWTQLR